MTLTDNGNGTFTDTGTGLTWLSEDDQIKRNYEEARVYCKELSIAGFSDWRLPTLAEFETLTKAAKTANYKVNTYFNAETDADYWSASIGPESNVAHIGDGTTMFLTNRYCVRAVRP